MQKSLKTLHVLPFLVALVALPSPLAYAAPLQVVFESQVEVKNERSILSGFLKKSSASSLIQLEQKVLGSYTLEDLAHRKQSTLMETDPELKKPAQFKGVSLSGLVEDAAKSLTADDRSHIDLIILKGKTKTAYMPRAFLVKYPTIQLALSENGKAISAPRVILPASSNTKIKRESVLLDTLFVPELESVVLTSYTFHYADLFLKKRTDPAAMRGEKLFMQNCLSCHQSGTKSASFAEVAAHPPVPEVSGLENILGPKQVRSLRSYLEAYQAQESNPVQK